MNMRSVIAMLLAFALPGAGHFYLGRKPRAAAFFVIVVVMFVAGLMLEGKIYRMTGGSLLTMLATLGSMGSGALYFIARAVGAPGNIASFTYEYGTAFTLTAGIMNLLLVLDAFDIAEGRKS